MHYREFPCHDRLAPLVECFWASENSPAATALTRVVPDGCIDIIFTCEATPQTDTCQLRLVGPMTAPFIFSADNPTTNLGVRFRPGGAPSLLGIASRELQDRHPTLREAWGNPAKAVLDRLAETPSLGTRLDLLQDFLLRRLDSAAGIDPTLHALIRRIETEDEPGPVEWMARSHGYGPRRLRRAFDRWVGLSPKQFSRIMRFQRLLARLRADGSGNLARQALECGYYDQPHMNRDFKRLAGVSPREFHAEAAKRDEEKARRVSDSYKTSLEASG